MVVTSLARALFIASHGAAPPGGGAFDSDAFDTDAFDVDAFSFS